MKRTFLLPALTAVLLSGSATIATAQTGKTRRAVFLGNSYTAVNNLPQLIATLAKSAGDTLLYAAHMPGGTTLQQHFTNPNSLSLIAAGNADYVVLQEQSQTPSFPDAQVNFSFYPYAKKLDSIADAQNGCSQTVFYRTWGRKNGDAQNCGFFPPLCTYEGMDSLLNLRYRNAADSAKALLSPVGNVWKRLRSTAPSINLYDADESHPSMEGSYAAACTFYSIFFSKSPLLITDNGGLPASTALTIRQAAKTVVFDSLAKWNVGRWPNTSTPVAGFNFTVAGKSVAFTNASVSATTYNWNFGNGTGSNLQNPTATYTQSGVYTVRLIAAGCNRTDTLTKSVTVGIVGITEVNSTVGELTLSPNPVAGEFLLTGTGIKAILELTNTIGQSFKVPFVPVSGGFSVDAGSLPAGVYLVQVATQNGVETLRFVKK